MKRTYYVAKYMSLGIYQADEKLTAGVEEAIQCATIGDAVRLAARHALQWGSTDSALYDIEKVTVEAREAIISRETL